MKQQVFQKELLLEQTSLLERSKSSVLIDGLESAATELHAHECAELRNPDTLGLKVRGNGALHHFGDVATDTAFFLRQTGTVNFAARADAGSSDTADTGHNRKRCGVAGRGEWPWRTSRQDES